MFGQGYIDFRLEFRLSAQGLGIRTRLLGRADDISILSVRPRSERLRV